MILTPILYLVFTVLAIVEVKMEEIIRLPKNEVLEDLQDIKDRQTIVNNALDALARDQEVRITRIARTLKNYTEDMNMMVNKLAQNQALYEKIKNVVGRIQTSPVVCDYSYVENRIRKIKDHQRNDDVICSRFEEVQRKVSDLTAQHDKMNKFLSNVERCWKRTVECDYGEVDKKLVELLDNNVKVVEEDENFVTRIAAQLGSTLVEQNVTFMYLGSVNVYMKRLEKIHSSCKANW